MFNGTIDKDGQRHTELGLEIEEGDVVALFNTLLKRHREKQNELICSLRDSQGETEVLRDAQTKIHDLISYHSEDAPSKNALIQAVRAIAEHYRWPFNKDEKPKIDWIKWDSI